MKCFFASSGRHSRDVNLLYAKEFYKKRGVFNCINRTIRVKNLPYTWPYRNGYSRLQNRLPLGVKLSTRLLTGIPCQI
jgi:hypothetical protein